MEHIMRHDLEFTEVAGSNSTHTVKVYALSTCGFCKRGIEYLKKNFVAFSYIYIDSLPLEEKRAVKDELSEASGKRVAFPFLCVDDEDYYVGFVEDDWKKALGI